VNIGRASRTDRPSTSPRAAERVRRRGGLPQGAVRSRRILDEGFFAFFEDVDIGIRAQLAGFRCWYEPRAVVRHRFSMTASRNPELKIFLLVRNGLKLFFQTMPARRVIAGARSCCCGRGSTPSSTGARCASRQRPGLPSGSNSRRCCASAGASTRCAPCHRAAVCAAREPVGRHARAARALHAASACS